MRLAFRGTGMDLLTVQETAALLKVSEGTVRRYVAAG